MAITRVQTTYTGGDAGFPGPYVATFGSSCTSGNTIIVIIRDGNNTAVTSIADTLLTSYSLAAGASDTSRDPRMWIYYGIASSTGANAVTVVLPGGAAYPWVYCIEVSGLASSSVLDVTDANIGTGVTDLVSNAKSTSQAEEYLVLGASQANLTSYTAGTDYTLVDGTIPTSPSDFGGVEERILSSVLSSYTSHITSGVTDAYTVVLASFKAPASATNKVGSMLTMFR